MNSPLDLKHLNPTTYFFLGSGSDQFFLGLGQFGSIIKISIIFRYVMVSNRFKY